MTFRMLVNSASVKGPSADMAAGIPAKLLVPAAAPGCARGTTKFSTSLAVIIPSMPDPDWIMLMSTPLSAATLLAAGLAKARVDDAAVRPTVGC